MRVEATPREVVFTVTLSQAEGVGAYWALADVCGAAAERDNHPTWAPLFELFDQLYDAGASEMTREP